VGEAALATLADDLDAGFAELYAAHRTVVFSTALRITGRWADAEDLTADSFLRAYRALADYDADRIGELQPRSWLLTILLNTWRNSRRTAAHQPATTPLEYAPEPVDPAESVEQRAERHETGRTLAGMLLRLPENQRVAVVLRHVSGLSIEEIAEVLGVPAGTVKSHISRGLTRLRALHDTPSGGVS
jgi:RNA polymerase sigma factor (sigma-70 family)